MFSNYLCSILIIVGLFSGEVLAEATIEASDSNHRISRYTQLDISPSHSQLQLLAVIVQLRFPDSIRTVGDALEYGLRNSGYRLAQKDIDNSQYVLFELPLPQIHRNLGPMSLLDVLTVLASEGFELEVNPIKRLVHFELIEQHRNAISQNEIAEATERWQKRKPKAQIRNLYGPTKSGDSLTVIAQKYSFTEVTLEQIVVAFYLANPGAFSHRNMNLLHEGVTLTIPDEKAISAYSAERAMQLVKEHEGKWLEHKGVK